LQGITEESPLLWKVDMEIGFEGIIY